MKAHKLECNEMENAGPGFLDQRERTRCEVWTRVMGYHRPVSAFNPGKQSEHAERIYFRQHDRTD
jgi:anaerobic ribonucleoside-triphosphate reductase